MNQKLSTLSSLSEQLEALMLASDRPGAARLVEKLLVAGHNPADILNHVLDPAMLRIGEDWDKAQTSLAQTYVAAKISEDILLRCRPAGTPATNRGVVVIGNIEDDFHSLGRRVVVAFLVAAGWVVHDLGYDVLAERFVETAVATGASVICVSAMMHSTALNISKVRNLIDARGLGEQLKLAVGGAVFNWRPELVNAVGGDGTARNAAGCDALVQRLQSEATAMRPS